MIGTLDPRVIEEARRQQNPASYSQPPVSAAAEPAPEIPSYETKKFFETGVLDDLTRRAASRAGGDLTIAQLRAGRNKRDPGDYTSAVDALLAAGLGSMTPNQIAQRGRTDAGFLEQYGLGKAFSYSDLALEALQSDPNFSPGDSGAVAAFAQELEKRGLTNSDREKIQALATTRSAQEAYDRAANPGKYLNEDQRTANLTSANELLAKTYGEVLPSYTADTYEAEYIADLLAQGFKPFEIAQELRVGQRYMEGKAAKDREALNQELLSSEEEVFKKASPQIIASYMKAGRLGSSGVDSALAKARAELANIRQNTLTGYAREDAVGARNAAFQQYLRQSEPAYQQQFAVQNAGNYLNFQRPWDNLARQYSLNDQNRAREWQVQDYNRMQSDFLRYMNSQRGSAGAGAFSGALSGAGAGASFGPWGALIGAGVGAFGGYQAYR